MNAPQSLTDYVAVEVAGKAAGIPARTLRHWISTGKLSAIAGKRGKLVSMGEVARLAVLVGKPVGNAETPPGNPATLADQVAGKVAETIADTSIVTDAARQQLASIRDEWLAPMVAKITDQAQTIGRLEAERDQLRHEVEKLGRQASLALPHATPSALATDTPAPPVAAGVLRNWWRRLFGKA